MTPITEDPDYRDFCQERLQDPYPLFRRLRSAEPVHWCEPIGQWLVTRYEDVYRGLRDPKLSSNRTGIYRQALPPATQERVRRLLDHVSRWVQLTDDPDHGRLRKLVNVAFTPRIVAAWRPRVESLLADLIAGLPADRPFDLAAQFCAPLPGTVICELLGVPPSARDRFGAAIASLMRFSSRGGPTLKDHADSALGALEELVAMFEPLIEERRRQPRPDLLSSLVSATVEGERLTDDELYAMAVFIFMAGHETTASGIASGVLALLQHPEQLAALRADADGKAEGAVEETLRYESPVPRAVRLAREDMEIGGVPIRAGQMVVLLLGAANRDPAQFTEPDRFDIGRKPDRHLGFGFGLHFCLGAHLARVEMAAAFRALARGCPGLRLAGGPLAWKAIMGLRSLDALPVVLAAGPR